MSFFLIEFAHGAVMFGRDGSAINVRVVEGIDEMKPDSYPFLAIAKAFGVDYGDVLLLADRIKNGVPEDGINYHFVEATKRLGRKI